MNDAVVRKIMDENRLQRKLAKLRFRDLTIVFTNGCFDLLHFGHVEYLERARAMGDFLFVGLNTDDSVRRLKGAPRPLQSQTARARVLAELESVDGVVLFDEDTPDRLIERIRPDVLVKGADYRVHEIAGRDFVEAYGGEVRTVPLIEGISTTTLMEQLCDYAENQRAKGLI